MAFNNPFEGGPDYVQSLANAVEAANAFNRPPKTGGLATSVRLQQERLSVLDVIAEKSGWTRNEVVTAFIDKGLWALFHSLSDDHASRLMDSAATQLFPQTHQFSKMEPFKEGRIDATARMKPNGRWYSVYSYVMTVTPTMIFTSEEWEPDFATDKEAIATGLNRAKASVETHMKNNPAASRN